MEFTLKRNVQIVAWLLFIAAITQAAYTVLYITQPEIDRTFLWSIESILFVVLAAFAGAAMLESKRYALGWSAIAMSAVLNVVQVGVGLTQFGRFFEAAGNAEALAPAAGSVVAYSFFVYNAAKMLLALAAIVFGMAKLQSGSKALGGLSALVGLVAFISNALSMALGRDFSGELPIAGGSGVLATILLAICLLTLAKEQD